MVEIINRKRYDTATAIKIAEKDHYNNGNYSGTTYLMASKNGSLFKYRDTNGQDCHLQDEIWLDEEIDGFNIIDEELATRYNLIEEA